MKRLSAKEALPKIQHYCAYQERCHSEARDKLYEFGLSRDEVEELMTELITTGFLNEERFARLFAGGKFRMKKWGRVKITNELQAKGVSANCIRFGLQEIDEAEYEAALSELILKKSETIEADNKFVLWDKVSKYAIQKGYEPELVWSHIKKISASK